MILWPTFCRTRIEMQGQSEVLEPASLGPWMCVVKDQNTVLMVNLENCFVYHFPGLSIHQSLEKCTDSVTMATGTFLSVRRNLAWRSDSVLLSYDLLSRIIRDAFLACRLCSQTSSPETHKPQCLTLTQRIRLAWERQSWRHTRRIKSMSKRQSRRQIWEY